MNSLVGLELILARKVPQADKRRITCWTSHVLLLSPLYAWGFQLQQLQGPRAARSGTDKPGMYG